MSCSSAGLPRATGYSPGYTNFLLPLDWTSFVLKTTCECSPTSKRHYYFLKTSETKLFRMARSHFTTSWELAFPNSHIVPCAISYTTHMTQTTNHGLTRCFWLQSDRWIFRYHTQSGLLNNFSLKSMSLIILFLEYPSFGDEGIQKIFSHAFRFCN